MLSLDKIRFQKKSAVMLIILMCMSLMFMGEVLLYQSVYAYSENVCKRILSKGIDGTGLIYVNDGWDTSDAKDFLHEAEESEMISSIGFCADGRRTNHLPELAKMQKEFFHEESDEQGLEWIFTNPGILEICDLKFQEVKEVKTKQWESDCWFGLYLGSNFKNIPIGTRYTYKADEDTEYVYEVVGTLEQGERFITETLLTGNGAGSSFNTYSLLDSLVICIGDIIPATPVWGYSVADGYTLKQGEASLKELAGKYGLSLDFSNLSAYFYYDKLSNDKLSSIFSEMFYLTFCVSVIINLSIFLVTFLNSMNEYGTFYAMGISKHELQCILTIENVIKCLFSFLLSWGIFYTLIIKTYVHNEFTLYIANDIVYHDILPYLLFITLLYIVLFSVAPFLILNYCKPVTLMKGNRI